MGVGGRMGRDDQEVQREILGFRSRGMGIFEQSKNE